MNIDDYFKYFDENKFINLFDNNAKLKEKYYIYVDESGEKKFELTKEGKYSIKKFNNEHINGFGFYIWGGIAKKTKKKINIICKEELKSSNYKMNFQNMIAQEDINKILMEIKNDYIHFYIQDIFLWILEDFIFTIFKNINLLTPNPQYGYEIFKSFIYDYFKSNNLHDIKKIIHTQKAKHLIIHIFNWLKINDFSGEEEIIAKEITRNITKIYEDCENEIFYFDYMLLTVHQLYIYQNSKIYYDEDLQLKKQLKKSKRIKNFSMLDSYDNIEIQVSDIIIGLVRRLFEFFNANSPEQINHELKNFPPLGVDNFGILKQILKKSANENSLFLGTMIDWKTRQKYEEIILKDQNK